MFLFFFITLQSPDGFTLNDLERQFNAARLLNVIVDVLQNDFQRRVFPLHLDILRNGGVIEGEVYSAMFRLSKPMMEISCGNLPSRCDYLLHRAHRYDIRRAEHRGNFTCRFQRLCRTVKTGLKTDHAGGTPVASDRIFHSPPMPADSRQNGAGSPPAP